MPKINKHPKDMTTEEIAKTVFHKKIHAKLKEIAHEKENNSESNLSSQ
ncbi:MAG: hypothetical protein ACLPVI_06720 [Dehalococcoidales bacterium]